MDFEVKQQLREKVLAQRFKFEETRKGDWKMIFPCEDVARNTVYEGFIKKANALWDEFTTGKNAKNKALHQEKRQGKPPVQAKRPMQKPVPVPKRTSSNVVPQ